ncbi:MAG: heavy-metal-associated domain-containing protein [Deltaproteobacteria bacterium]
MGSILRNVDGVIRVQTDIQTNEVTVTFDDTKASYDDIEEALSRHKVPPTGEPEYLK